jgi:hypothetical protein
MATEVFNGYYLLLLFKDELPDATGQGFPLVSDSPSITQHLVLQGGKPADETLFPIEDLEAQPKSPQAVTSGSCVWGWWRKPWESHPALFARLRQACEAGEAPCALLYNQYLTHIYAAKVRAIYFDPWLTTSVIPANWERSCPERYRNDPRLCGAFLALEIERTRLKDARKKLAELYVDSSSFELSPGDNRPVIPVPAGVYDICLTMIDRPPDRAALRSCEHTILLLRDFKQRESTKQLLEGPDVPEDAQLADSFMETEWQDVRLLLSELGPTGWARLATSKMALEQIGRKAQAGGSRITRLDLELAARACASREVGDLLVARSSPGPTFSDLGRALVSWATSSSAREARDAASTVLVEAWKVAKKLYGLADLPKYFEQLPALEAVASAVRYEIGRKFYRDHLSHNIRAALLAVRVFDSTLPSLPEGVSGERVAFFAGLFHDIAFPVSAFPQTVETLANALNSIQMCDARFRPQRLLDPSALKKSLSYVSSLASVPEVFDRFRSKAFTPWDDPAQSMKPVDKRLLQELLLCSGSEEHAVISAAILFDRAVLHRCGGRRENFDTGLRTLMPEMTGQDAKREMREFLAIIQSVALHDRKPASEFHGVATVPRDVPTALRWGDFALPAVLAIADEMQEWGRPIAALEEIASVDADFQAGSGTLSAEFRLNATAKTFKGVPYSLLEGIFGKLRVAARIRFKKPKAQDVPLRLSLKLRDLEAFVGKHVVTDEFSIRFEDKCTIVEMAKWPKEGGGSQEVRGETDDHLIMIRASSEGIQGRDFIVLSGDARACEQAAQALREEKTLAEIALDGALVRIRFRNGFALEGKLETYWFGPLRLGESVPTGTFASDGPSAVARIVVGRSGVGMPGGAVEPGLTPHAKPYPHFLDFDWRFTDRTAQWIVKTACHLAGGGPICYLGCPSAAIWHHLLRPHKDTWLLLDRGHFALREWLNSLIPAERYRSYNVFSALGEDTARKFAVVVTDPPWYREEYLAFCRRAAQLVAPDGCVCISDYPPCAPYKPHKHKELDAIMRRELGRYKWRGSFEIDYEVPEFERSWGGHEQFQHLALGVYRPGYMDVYQIRRVDQERVDGPPEVPPQFLPEVWPLKAGHYLRCARDIPFPLGISIRRRRDIRHIRNLDPAIVCWSTANAIVTREDGTGTRVENREELCAEVERWEAAQRPPGAADV